MSDSQVARRLKLFFDVALTQSFERAMDKLERHYSLDPLNIPPEVLAEAIRAWSLMKNFED